MRETVDACTTPSILSEVYAALTWERAEPRHDPREAAEAVRLLVVSPSAIRVLDESFDVALRALDLAVTHALTARRAHDARHAAAALTNGIPSVYTYDREDWRRLSRTAYESLDLPPRWVRRHACSRDSGTIDTGRDNPTV